MFLPTGFKHKNRIKDSSISYLPLGIQVYHVQSVLPPYEDTVTLETDFFPKL